MKQHDIILLRKSGDPLVPDRNLNTEFLKRMKIQSGMYYYNALYQGKPTNKGSGYFDSQYYKYYKDVPKDIVYSLISVDCAEEDKSSSDYSVLQYWVETKTGYYLIDQSRGKWNFPTLEKNTLQFCEKYKSNKVVIEAKSSGKALYQNLKHHTKLPVIGENPTISKKERVGQIIGQIESGNVYFPENVKWMFDFLTELDDFPNGNHDDQVDCLSQAIKYLVFSRRIIKIRSL